MLGRRPDGAALGGHGPARPAHACTCIRRLLPHRDHGDDPCEAHCPAKVTSARALAFPVPNRFQPAFSLNHPVNKYSLAWSSIWTVKPILSRCFATGSTFCGTSFLRAEVSSLRWSRTAPARLLSFRISRWTMTAFVRKPVFATRCARWAFLPPLSRVIPNARRLDQGHRRSPSPASVLCYRGFAKLAWKVGTGRSPNRDKDPS